MKIIMYGALLCAVAASLQAKIESNKTFIRSRDSLSHNLIMNLTGNTWRKDKKLSIGSQLSVASYYRTSYNARDIALSLGGGQSVNNDQIGRLVVQPNESVDFQSEAYYLYSAAIDHMGPTSDPIGGTTGGMFGTLTFNPSRTEYGAHVSWEQDLSFILKNASFRLDVPIVYVKHDLGTVFAGYPHTETTYGQTGSTLQNYFAGNLLTKTSAASQQALQYMRIDGNAHSKTGVADIQLGLNYNFYNDPTFRVYASAHLTLPTCGTTTAIDLFEPTVGSGFVASGLRGTLIAKLFRSENRNHSLTGIASADYRYFFQGTKTRTLGLYNFQYGAIATGGHYRNIGEVGGNQVIPAANLLTRQMLVKPGQLIDGVLGARYNYKDFGISLFYNIHAHEHESVVLAPNNKWQDGTYGMMGHGANVSTGGHTTSIVIGNTYYTYGGEIQQQGNISAYTVDSSGSATYLDPAQYYVTTSACQSKADITHKIAAISEWHCRTFYFPINMSAGAEYEIGGLSTTNSGIHSWSLWSKFSICF